eukprot:2685955-Prymnesium_polylepis.2
MPQTRRAADGSSSTLGWAASAVDLSLLSRVGSVALITSIAINLVADASLRGDAGEASGERAVGVGALAFVG